MLGFQIHRNDDSQAVFAEGTIAGMRGETGAGFYRFILAVRLHINPAPDPSSGRSRMTGLIADVHVGEGVNLGRFVGHPWQLGNILVPTRQARSQEVYLECDMDRGRLEAIEALRAGDSLTLTIGVQAQIDDGEWQTQFAELTVNQSSWAAVLKDVGYRQTLMIEVPVPSALTDPELTAAVAYLDQAQSHLLAGHDRDAVGACRDVLEELKKLPGADLPEPTGGQQAMTKAERVMKLRKALTTLTHPARHRDEDAARILWGRIDAQAIIAMTAGLIMEMSADEARQP
jgi:hypothetical protein